MIKKEIIEELRIDIENLQDSFSRLRKICKYLISKIDIAEEEQKVLSLLLSRW